MGIEKNVKIERIEFKIEAEEELQLKWKEWIKKMIPWTPNIDLLSDIIDEENKPNEISRYFSRVQTEDLLIKVVISSHFAVENFEMMLDIINLAGKLYAKVIEIKEKEEYKFKTLFLIGDKSTGLLSNL